MYYVVDFCHKCLRRFEVSVVLFQVPIIRRWYESMWRFACLIRDACNISHGWFEVLVPKMDVVTGDAQGGLDNVVQNSNIALMIRIDWVAHGCSYEIWGGLDWDWLQLEAAHRDLVELRKRISNRSSLKEENFYIALKPRAKVLPLWSPTLEFRFVVLHSIVLWPIVDSTLDTLLPIGSSYHFEIEWTIFEELCSKVYNVVSPSTFNVIHA